MCRYASRKPLSGVSARGRAERLRQRLFWLEPVALADNRGFRSHELTDISKLVVEHRQFFLEKWHEYFGRTS